MVPFSTLPLALACLLLSSLQLVMALRTTVEAAQAVGLVPRAAVCGGDQGLSQCGSSFPSSFCCKSDTKCFGFNNNQGVICCPEDSCAVTNPLSCDIQIYNATANPSSPMHLSDLNAQLQSCGTSTCCPPGYTCQNQNECVLNTLVASISSVASTAKSTSVPTPTAVTGISASITSAPPSATSNSAISVSTNGAAAASSSTDQFPIQAVLVGLFPGLVGGCLLAFLFVLCLGRRKSNHKPDDDTSSFGPVAAKVSDPIYMDSATRTDFLRYQRSSRSPQGSTSTSPVSRVRSLFRKTPSLSPGQFGEQSSPRGMGDVSTPPRQIRREPSMESIKIYSPPDARFGRNTTFGDLLKNAVPDASAPPTVPLYMGSPGMVDPRSRGVDAGNLR